MKTQPINTTVGQIHGRDAIYLDEFRHVFTPDIELYLKGSFSASSCRGYTGTADFPNYTLFFKGVQFYSCCELEHYKKEPFLSSSFDLVLDSQLMRDLKFESAYKHYIVSTYDFVYEVIAESYKMQVED